MEASIIFGILTLANILFTTWLAFRRTKSQNILDDSTASVNYRKVIIEMQEEVTRQGETIKELRSVINHAHLEIELSIQMDNAPVIKNWKWKPIVPEEEKK